MPEPTVPGGGPVAGRAKERGRGAALPTSLGLRAAALVPALDEAETLARTLAALPGRLDRPLVVDNGSRDGTAEVARAGGAQVVEEPRRGYGRACRRGLRTLAARSAPPDAVVFLDADDPLAAAQVERLLAPLETGRADLVLGRRAGPGDGPPRPEGGVPRHAALGNALVTAVLRGLYGAEERDLGPFRAARLAPLLELGLDDPAFGWNVQMQVRAHRRGWRVFEVPVHHRGRAAGRSKISGSLPGSARAAAGMLAALLREIAAPSWAVR